jgi:hypothetical protein
MLDSHPEVVCKGEARLVTSPFTEGKGLWDYLLDGVRQWVVQEGSRKGNGFLEPADDQIAWRQGDPVVTSGFIRGNTDTLATAASTTIIQYLLLNNITEKEKATGEKTPIIKAGDVNRFKKIKQAIPSAKLIVTHRNFSDWFKSYHKHNMYRWDTTQQTLNFFPFTRDDYVATVRGVRDDGKAPGQMVTTAQIDQASEMYRQVTVALADIADFVLNYEEMKQMLDVKLSFIFKHLKVDPTQATWIAREHAASDTGKTDQDASQHSLEEYFGDEAIVDYIKQQEEELKWLTESQ